MLPVSGASKARALPPGVAVERPVAAADHPGEAVEVLVVAEAAAEVDAGNDL